MIGYVFIIVAIIAMVLSDIAKKKFTKSCPFLFSFICCIFALLVFLISAKFKITFTKDVLIYAVLFAISYALAILFITLSYKVGSFSFTGLFISYSLLLPTLYGIIILKDSTKWCFYVGLALLCAAIFLITFKKQTVKNNHSFNAKWFIFIIIGFIANGFCSIFQTAEQNALDGKYKNELMVIALAISGISFLILSLILERRKIKDGFKQSLACGSISGILNGILNLCVLYSVNYVNASIVFPFISGGALALTFIIARVFFKEKHSVIQYIGFVISIASIIFLNI